MCPASDVVGTDRACGTVYGQEHVPKTIETKDKCTHQRDRVVRVDESTTLAPAGWLVCAFVLTAELDINRPKADA